jgi:hypothetical protein
MVSVRIISWSYGEGLIIKINKWNVAQHNYDEFPPNPPNSPSNFLTDDIDIPTPNTAVQESSQEESPNHSHNSTTSYKLLMWATKVITKNMGNVKQL